MSQASSSSTLQPGGPSPPQAVMGVPASLKVAVRFRSSPEPASKRIQLNLARNEVVLLNQKDRKTTHNFDWVLGADATQKEVYESVGSPVVEKLFSWYNSTIFAYGQTGSGKTHSMLGKESPSEEWGIIPRVVEAVFARLAKERQHQGCGEHQPTAAAGNVRERGESATALGGGGGEQPSSLLEDTSNMGMSTELLVKCSYVEIYQERVVDLLCPSPNAVGGGGGGGGGGSSSSSTSTASRLDSGSRLRVRTSPDLGTYVEGAHEVEAGSASEVLRVMSGGSARRRVASHALNERSSRSHAVFTLKLEQVYSMEGRRITRRCAKVNLVDLAGSERQKETHAEGVRLQESSAINKSLLTLQRVLKSLARNASGGGGGGQQDDNATEGVAGDLAAAASASAHCVIPFRESKLTHLLQESFGGGAFCCMLACVAPLDAFLGQTHATLRYASGARAIRQVVRRVRDISAQEALQSELHHLQGQISQARRDHHASEAAALRRQMEALVRVMDQSSRAQRHWADQMEVERAAVSAQLTVPARAVVRLERAGSSQAPALRDLERSLANQEQAYHHQRRFIVGLEEALRVELAGAAGGEAGERELEGVLVRLRTVQSESKALKGRRAQIADLYKSILKLMEEEEARLHSSLPEALLSQLTNNSVACSRAGGALSTIKECTEGSLVLPKSTEEDDEDEDEERDDEEEGVGEGPEEEKKERVVVGNEDLGVEAAVEGQTSETERRKEVEEEGEGAASSFGGMGLEDGFKQPESVEVEALKALKDLKRYCEDGMEKLRKAGQYGEDPDMTSTLTQVGVGIDMLSLMALIEELPQVQDSSLQDGGGSGSVSSSVLGGSGGGVAEEAVALGSSLSRARLAWGDTRAIDCVSFAIDKIETVLTDKQRRKAASLEEVLHSEQVLRSEVWRLERALEASEGEAREAREAEEDWRDQAEEADRHMTHLFRELQAQRTENAALQRRVDELHEDLVSAENDHQDALTALNHTNLQDQCRCEEEKKRLQLQIEALLREVALEAESGRMASEEVQSLGAQLLEEKAQHAKERARAQSSEARASELSRAEADRLAGDDEATESRWRAQAEATRAELAVLHESQASTRAELAAAHQSQLSTMQELARVQVALSGMTAERDQAISLHASTDQRLTELEQECTRTRGLCTEREKENASLSVQLHTALERIKTWEQDAAKATGSVSRLESDLNVAQSQVALQDARHEEAQSRLQSLEAQHKLAQEALDKIREDLACERGLKQAQEIENARLAEKVDLIEKGEMKSRADMLAEKNEADRLRKELELKNGKSKACIIV